VEFESIGSDASIGGVGSDASIGGVGGWGRRPEAEDVDGVEATC